MTVSFKNQEQGTLEELRSWFKELSYIILFKCPTYNKKNRKTYKVTGYIVHSRKKLNLQKS